MKQTKHVLDRLQNARSGFLLLKIFFVLLDFGEERSEDLSFS